MTDEIELDFYTQEDKLEAIQKILNTESDDETVLRYYKHKSVGISLGYRPSEERLREVMCKEIMEKKILKIELNLERDSIGVWYIVERGEDDED